MSIFNSKKFPGLYPVIPLLNGEGEGTRGKERGEGRRGKGKEREERGKGGEGLSHGCWGMDSFENFYIKITVFIRTLKDIL